MNNITGKGWASFGPGSLYQIGSKLDGLLCIQSASVCESSFHFSNLALGSGYELLKQKCMTVAQIHVMWLAHAVSDLSS